MNRTNTRMEAPCLATTASEILGKADLDALGQALQRGRGQVRANEFATLVEWAEYVRRASRTLDQTLAGLLIVDSFERSSPLLRVRA